MGQRKFYVEFCGLTAEKVVGLHPTPDQGGLLVLSSLDAPWRPQRSWKLLVLIGKFAIASEVLALHPCKALQFGNPCLSLISAKITDFHSPLPLRKLARYLIGGMSECREVYGCTWATIVRYIYFYGNFFGSYILRNWAGVRTSWELPVLFFVFNINVHIRMICYLT